MKIMKPTGITKRIDPLGRLLIPKPERKALNISEEDTLELFIGDEGELIIKKYELKCIFCGSNDDIKEFESKKICKCCIDKIREIC